MAGRHGHHWRSAAVSFAHRQRQLDPTVAFHFQKFPLTPSHDWHAVCREQLGIAASPSGHGQGHLSLEGNYVVSEQDWPDLKTDHA